MQDIPDLLDGLRRTPKILSEFIKTIPEDKMDLRRGEDFWTIAEHVSHLAQVQPMLLERFQRFMNEDRPVFTPYIPSNGENDPNFPLSIDMVTALEQFGHYRNKELMLLEGVDAITWQKIGIHQEYDHYSLYILARHILLHDYWHMYRIETLWLTKDAYLTKME